MNITIQKILMEKARIEFRFGREKDYVLLMSREAWRVLRDEHSIQAFEWYNSIKNAVDAIDWVANSNVLFGMKFTVFDSSEVEALFGKGWWFIVQKEGNNE